jgi:hypothetical protein
MLAALTSHQSSSHDMQFTILINYPQPEHHCSVLPEDYIGHRQKEHVSCHLSCLSKVSDWVGELELSHSHLLIINGTNVTWQLSNVTAAEEKWFLPDQKQWNQIVNHHGSNNSFLNTIRYVSRETRLLYAIATSRISTFAIIWKLSGISHLLRW